MLSKSEVELAFRVFIVHPGLKFVLFSGHLEGNFWFLLGFLVFFLVISPSVQMLIEHGHCKEYWTFIVVGCNNRLLQDW